MKTAVILLLGNRDIQIHKDKFDEVKAKFAKYFVLNQDDQNYYIVDKFDANKTGKKFLEISEMIWNEYEYFSNIVEYRLWELSLEVLQKQNIKIDNIFITTSQQKIPNKQDTFFFAYSIEKHLKEKGYNAELKLCNENPTDFEVMVSYYIDLFNNVSNNFNHIYISNTGGTPQMRTSSHFAGIFRNFEYISIGSTDKNATKTFKNQENQILNQIIEKMLAVYDYEGILSLPVSEKIKKLAQEAINLYNLETDYVTKHTKYDKKSEAAIELIYNNMYVCYKQGRYADVIGRIHRIEEASGQYLFYRILEEKKAINENEKVERTGSKGKTKADVTFENVLKNRPKLESVLNTHFSEIFEFNEAKLNYSFKQFPKVPMLSGKNFFYFFFKSLNKHTKLYDFYYWLNNEYDMKENKLTNLRNNSILGHGFKGVSLEAIEEVTGNFDAFLSKLKNLIKDELGKEINLFFDQINQKIISLF